MLFLKKKNGLPVEKLSRRQFSVTGKGAVEYKDVDFINGNVDVVILRMGTEVGKVYETTCEKGVYKKLKPYKGEKPLVN